MNQESRMEQLLVTNLNKKKKKVGSVLSGFPLSNQMYSHERF